MSGGTMGPLTNFFDGFGSQNQKIEALTDALGHSTLGTFSENSIDFLRRNFLEKRLG